MSIEGTWQTGTIALNGTATGEIDLGRDYDLLDIILPTLTSGTLKVQVTDITGGTFQDLGNAITTKATTGAFNDIWKLGGWRYVKIVSSASQAAARTIKVRGRNY